jgi:hypothetical protein
VLHSPEADASDSIHSAGPSPFGSMSSNTICLRIFFVLFLLIVGGLLLFLYAARAITPLAVCLLPTDKAEARYVGAVLMEYNMNSTQQVFHSDITYAGHTATLLTTSAPTPLADLATASSRFDAHPGGIRAGLSAPQAAHAPQPVVNIRYVRMFPNFVVRDLPDGSLWSYYADTWTAREAVSCFVWMALLILVGWLFYRHLRKWRSRSYR